MIDLFVSLPVMCEFSTSTVLLLLFLYIHPVHVSLQCHVVFLFTSTYIIVESLSINKNRLLQIVTYDVGIMGSKKI